MGKQNGNLMWIAVILAIVLVVGGGVTIPQIDLSGILGNTLGTGGRTDVDKILDFALTDVYAGSALGTKTIYVYDSDGETLLESLTTASDGTIVTAFPYPSGKRIYVNFLDSNSKQWFDITVPQMLSKDAESATVNTIRLSAFQIGTYTSDALKFGATSISDAGAYNFTLSGDSQTFTYSLANTGSDNTGVISSYDPIYDMKWSPVIYMTLSGTEYEKVLVYGFNNDFTLGSTHYVASEVDDYALTKHKVGNQYKSGGTLDYTFQLDGTGYTGSGATTCQITVYMYSDPSYCMNKGGAFGPASVEIAEHTFTLDKV